MNFFLTKLSFETAVHFGSSDSALSLYTSEDHFRADTLFSALCHTALQQDGEAGLQRLVNLAKAGDLLLSDSMPWCGETLFLPKPVIAADSHREAPADLRKAVKKASWIPVLSLPAFADSLHGGEPWIPEPAASGRNTERTCAAVTDGMDALPYQIGLYQFYEDCGLYILFAIDRTEDADWILSLLKLLGLSGIGGKTSAGFGKFHITSAVDLEAAAESQAVWIRDALARESGRQLLLTSSLPQDAELDVVLDGAYYQLVRRGGFVSSDTFETTAMKKKTQYFLAAGAVLPCRFQGDVLDVRCGGNHPVYRYARPLLLGVEL